MQRQTTPPVVLLRNDRRGRWELHQSSDGKQLVVYVTSAGHVGLVMLLPEAKRAGVT
jgi:hypothetical protein